MTASLQNEAVFFYICFNEIAINMKLTKQQL